MTFLKYAILQGALVHYSIKLKEILMELITPNRMFLKQV